jgi:protein-tyrosine-phosphatase/predicted ATP-grasp superfamily ATP-dependent carboligase
MTPTLPAGQEKILVLGRDGRSFLTVVRALGRAGYQVHAATRGHPGDSSLKSRYVHTVHDMPKDANSPEADTAMVALLLQEGFALVLPCTDQDALLLRRIRHLVPVATQFYLSNDEAEEVFSSKVETHRRAQALGIAVGEGEIVSTREQALAAMAALPLPLVMKPQRSYFANNLHKRHSVTKHFSVASAQKAIDDYLGQGEFLIQTNAIGVGMGYEVFCVDGKVLLEFQHERIHEPAAGGASTYRAGNELDPGFRDATHRLMASVRHTGVAMVEFKKDRQTGQWILIEVNGRFWGSLELAVRSGANFPLALVQYLLQGKLPQPGHIRRNLLLRSVFSDTDWFLQNLRADRSNPALCTVPLPAIAAEARHLLLGRERWDSVVLDDMAPWLQDLGDFTGGFARKINARVHRLWLFSAPGQSLEHGRLAKHLAKGAKSALFICYGNICRSPLAEQKARQMGLFERIASSGFHAKAGRESPEHALAAAQGMGLDLTPHRSQTLNAEQLARADVVFVFDLENFKMMREQHPGAMHKVFLLGTANRLKGEIADPWGHSAQTFVSCYRTIAQCLEQLAALKR